MKYQTFDPAQRYVSIGYHADRVVQSREMNDGQAMQDHARKEIADVLFADGDITSGARCTVNADTGACQLEAGKIYIAGRVHPVDAASIVVPTAGTASVGVRYRKEVVTALDDPGLYNPAVNTEGWNEEGADRTRITLTWELLGSGTAAGDFYPIWRIEDGIVIPREPAPTINAVTDAIKRYDVDSTGGSYVVRGMETTLLPDADGKQIYSISAGAARVLGIAIESPVARKLIYAAQANTAAVGGEPHVSLSEAQQRIAFERWPVLTTATLRVQRRKTVELVHAPIVGAADPLPDGSVVRIVEVKQGGTTYANPADYKLTASQVDWSPGGAEPIPGSSYSVTYEYISTEPAQDQTTRDFAVTGALSGTVIYVDYEVALRRVDVITIDPEGKLDVVKGIPALWNAVKPVVPLGQLALASIMQTWDERRQVWLDAVRTVPMDVLTALIEGQRQLRLDQAELRLATDVSGRYGGLKKGYFADPMLDNSMRDQGIVQTALITGGALQLGEPVEATNLDDGATRYSIQFELVKAISQPAASMTMKVTPPAAPGVPPPQLALPATVTLMPAVDRWVEPVPLKYPAYSFYHGGPKESFSAAHDEALERALGDFSNLDTSTVFMREREVQFDIAGFNPGEMLTLLMFDGAAIPVLPLQGGTLAANAEGKVQGRFDVPPNLPVGTKQVSIMGAAGSYGSAEYTGHAEVTIAIWHTYSNYRGNRGSGRDLVTHVI